MSPFAPGETRPEQTLMTYRVCFPRLIILWDRLVTSKSLMKRWELSIVLPILTSVECSTFY